jgi:FkbM family methyltransferase
MSSADELIVVSYRDRPLRFVPCGGRFEHMLRANQWYEAALLDYIEALALPGIYLDIGGYIGTHALFFAAHCPSERVITFEPRSQCHQVLRRNIDANGLGGKVELATVGLADRDQTVTVRLEDHDATFACRRLDDLVTGPVGLIKIDIEGMEPQALAGARRILRESRPLVFAEAHSNAHLQAILDVLAPFGYRPTGRVFNDSPTYELAADDSPVAPPSRLPARRSLIGTVAWGADDAAVEVRTGAGGLQVSSTLTTGGRAHVTQMPARLKHPSADPALAVPPGSTWFVEGHGRGSAFPSSTLFVMQYAAGERVAVGKFGWGARTLQRLELDPRTDRLRVAVRVIGPGEMTVDRLALHGPVSPR